MLRRLSLGIFIGSASVVVLAAGCTGILGSFEVGPGGTADDGSTTTDGTTGTDGPSGNDGGGDGSVDAPPTCTAPEVACGNECANLKTSAKHCNACGRSCGGGTCTNGVCSPGVVVPGTTNDIQSFDVATGAVIFSTDDRLLSCPKDTGCTATITPKQLGQTQYGFRTVTWQNSTNSILFESAPVQSTQRPAMYGCPPAGCPGVLDSWIGDGLGGFESRIRLANNEVYVSGGNTGLAWSTCSVGTCASPAHTLGLKGTHGFVAGGNQVYFVDSAARGGTIARCSKNDTACVPTTIVPGDHSSVEALELYQNTLYWIQKGRDGFNEGKIYACTLTLDCSVIANQKVLVNGLDSPTELLVDAGGLTWITAGAKLQRCDNTACTGGAKDVLPAAIPGVHNIVTNAGFLYWAEPKRILRLAR